MDIKFTKMQGLGNDFVVIDGINQAVALSSQQIRQIADRRFGVGCDQVLLLEQSVHADADFNYRIFNGDGSEVEQCGNGARCAAQFIQQQGLSTQRNLRLSTLKGSITCSLNDNGSITVDMGVPQLTVESIPLAVEQQRTLYELKLDRDHTVKFSAVSMGNPHAVIVVTDIAAAPVIATGKALQQHEIFPASVNVGFMQIIDQQNIKLRVYERGVGETLACGSGACAAVVAGSLQGLLSTKVNVHLTAGALQILWAGVGQSVLMTGPASSVFQGSIRL